MALIEVSVMSCLMDWLVAHIQGINRQFAP